MSYTPFKYFGKNAYGRDFVVGDIHGSFTALEQLLLQINFNPVCDRLFSVGDLIDRGPESHRVVEFLDYPWFHAVMGNHEQMLLDAAHDTNTYDTWVRYNGGAWWREIPAKLQLRIRNMVASLPMAFEIGTDNGQFGVVNADIPTGLSWKKFIQNLGTDVDIAEYALWSRNRYQYYKLLGRTNPVEGVDWVIFGHTPVNQPLQVANFYYIDTGAALLNDKSKGILTLMQIHPNRQIYQFNVRELERSKRWTTFYEKTGERKSTPALL